MEMRKFQVIHKSRYASTNTQYTCGKIDFNIISAVCIRYDPFQQDFNRYSSVEKISVFIAAVYKLAKRKL